VLRVVVTERQRRGSLFAPMHWNDQFASNARVGALVAGRRDPVSGQPELKFTPIAARKYAALWHGFAVSTAPMSFEGADNFALAPTKGGWRAELAGLAWPTDCTAFAHNALVLGDDAELVAYHDAGAGRHRFVAFRGAVVVGALFIAREPVTVARSWIAELLGRPLAPADRPSLLCGGPAGPASDRGPIVCVCYEVGRNEILATVVNGNCVSVADIEAQLGAGANCGSCRGEIGRLIASAGTRLAG
jgi:assimilatory nitrate reductase catalytic subunit